MLSSSPPAVLPLIRGLPPLSGHPHPPSARTCCTPAALPVTLMDTAWSFQSSLYQETACSFQGWEHTEHASSVPEPPPSWHCIAHTPCNAPWSSEGPWMKLQVIPTGHRKKTRKDSLQARNSLSLSSAETVVLIPLQWISTVKLFFTSLH